MAKSVKATAVAKITAAQRRVINEAAAKGYDLANGFEGAVAHLAKLRGSDDSVIAAYAKQYKLGFGVSYMERHDKGYAKRTSNQPLEVKLEAIDDIFALKSRPSETDPAKVIKGMRSPLQQRMTRGADQSFVRVKEGAGMKVKRTRTVKAPAAPAAPEPPLDLTKLTPTFANKAAANDWFVNAAAALLTACDKNNSKSKGKLVIPQITSAVADFQAAVKKALGL
jgi:hypothetical protein